MCPLIFPPDTYASGGFDLRTYKRGVGPVSGVVKTYNFLSGTLPSDLTFSRASSAWYFNSSGVLTQASSNAPRFDYGYYGSSSLQGLLAEGQSTNLALQSNAFTTSPWTKSAAVTAGAATSPDGTTDAFSFLASAAYQYARQSITLSGSTTYTLSCWLRVSSGTYTNLELYGYDGTSQYGVTPTITTTWTRYTKTFTTVASPSAGTIYLQDNNTSGWQTVYIYGMQLEQGSLATSYIPTTTVTVTRAADSLYNSSLPWFNATTGTFVARGILEGANTSHAAYLSSFSDGTANNNIALFANTSGKAQGGDTVSGTAYTSAATAGSPVVGTAFKQALKYASGSNVADFGSTIDGAGTFGAAAIPSGISRLDLGNNVSGTAAFNGWLQSFSYYNTALTNAQIQGL
jgi:hypothetical protein